MKDFLRKSVLGISIVPLKKDHSNAENHGSVTNDDPFLAIAEDMLSSIKDNDASALSSALRAFKECPAEEEEQDEEEEPSVTIERKKGDY